MARGRPPGAATGEREKLLLALLDWWKDSVRTVLLAEVAVTDSPRGQLEAVWDRVAGDPEDQSGRWALLEHELWLRAARDPDVAEVMRERNAEARRFSARQLAGWSAEVGAHPAAEPEELAVLVTALLAGLAMQRRLEPDAVSAEVAVSGLCALVGLTEASPPADHSLVSMTARPMTANAQDPPEGA